METLLFDPTDKSAVIDLAMLDRTLKFEDAGGKLPQSAPIHHADLIKRLIELAHRHVPNYEPIMSPIVVKQQNCKRVLFKGPANECPLENYAVERIVARIGFKGTHQFKGIEDAEGAMAMGISYNEKGIQVAFGHNVRVCQNLNVFGDNIFTTYGSDTRRVPFEKGMQLVEHWMQNVDNIKELNRVNIEKLRAVKVTENERLRVFGKIYEMAIRVNEGDKKLDAPLNVTECNKMVAKGFDLITSGGDITAWDVTNWATSVLKPETSDMLNLMVKNARLNQFMLHEFTSADLN